MAHHLLTPGHTLPMQGHLCLVSALCGPRAELEGVTQGL